MSRKTPVGNARGGRRRESSEFREGVPLWLREVRRWGDRVRSRKPTSVTLLVPPPPYLLIVLLRSLVAPASASRYSGDMHEFLRRNWFLSTLAVLIVCGMTLGALGYGPRIEPAVKWIDP